MPTNYKSDTDILDGRTELLKSRPEQDMIVLFGLYTLIGSVFCVLGLFFLVYFIIEDWPDILSIIGLTLLLIFPVAYTLYALDMLVWQIKGVETVSYDENGMVIHLKKLFDRETTVPWDSIVEVEKYESRWWAFFNRSYLYNASLRIHYRLENGHTNTIRFGLRLSEKQEDDTIEKISELRDKFSSKMDYSDGTISTFTLTNANGLRAGITNLGGRVVSLLVPDKNGVLRDVVLGFDKLEDYLPEKHRSDFGAVIGRYANRLKNGQITIDGHVYQLPQNDGKNCLHGGPDGWQYRMFNVESVSDSRLVLSLVSEDGDSGFPGNVCARVTYMLTDDNALDIQYEAVTDEPTVINMTNHSYFNLNGDASTDILNHLLTIDAGRYTPIGESFIPTGELASVDSTPMDFRQAKAVGCDIASGFEQLRIGRGYDHNWVLNTKGDDSRPCARLESLVTGIAMEVFTTEPGMQIYTGNFLDGSVIGKNGIAYQQRSAVCLETQKFPDSPNQHWLESNAFLRPGETYKSHTKYRFPSLAINN